MRAAFNAARFPGMEKKVQRLASLLFSLILMYGLTAEPGRAHDLPGDIPISGFFDTTGEQPQLTLRVPLILLTNLNLPKRGPGYLDLANFGDSMTRAEGAILTAFRVSADGQLLEPSTIDSRISMPSERTFETPEAAAAAIVGPALPVDSNVFWNQGFFDIRIGYPAQTKSAKYALTTELPAGVAERILISLGIINADASMRTLAIDGTSRQIALDPAWYQAGFLFLSKGVEHILIGSDHLLFLICLILPFRAEPRRLLGVITAFTLGHSATLIPAALGMAPDARWFLPLVETLIAVSILYMAVENIIGAGARFRWRLAFGFGLIHGFGFASTLTDVVPFAGSHLLTSLIFFNVGIEVGQVLFLAVVIPVLALLFRSGRVERSGIIVISALAAHEAWHWATERAADIRLDVPIMGDTIFAALAWFGIALCLVLAVGAFTTRSRWAPSQPQDALDAAAPGKLFRNRGSR